MLEGENAKLKKLLAEAMLDNTFIERLWRSIKYECVYLHA